MCISDMSSCSLVLVIMCISVAICPPVVWHLYTLSPEQDYRRTYYYTYTHYHQNKTAGGHIATLIHIITRTRLQEDILHKSSDMSSCSLVLVIMCISAVTCPPVVQEDISLHLYTLSPEQDCRRTYRYTYTHYHQNKTTGGHITTLIHITRTRLQEDISLTSCSLVLVIMCISVAICPPAVLFWW
jgi:hypothetical protein